MSVQLWHGRSCVQAAHITKIQQRLQRPLTTPLRRYVPTPSSDTSVTPQCLQFIVHRRGKLAKGSTD
jgi:hypothetical protein